MKLPESADFPFFAPKVTSSLTRIGGEAWQKVTIFETGFFVSVGALEDMSRPIYTKDFTGSIEKIMSRKMLPEVRT